ncbi:hypothetical protein SC206_06445 [Rouxiella sp. T17]|uniref:hypothetical protein n=1 Tax=Rouxiella sp. T17 TaxID=3085684 RepID=UPI002FC94200
MSIYGADIAGNMPKDKVRNYQSRNKFQFIDINKNNRLKILTIFDRSLNRCKKSVLLSSLCRWAVTVLRSLIIYDYFQRDKCLLLATAIIENGDTFKQANWRDEMTKEDKKIRR